MHRFTLVLAATLVVAGAACGPQDANGDGIADGVQSPDNVTLVAPSTPQGTVSGLVLDTRLQPLGGVSATLTVGAATADGSPRAATTAADGSFSFTNVPGGSDVVVTLEKQGFGTVRSHTFVPGTAGNFPINNGNGFVGPFALTQNNGTFQLLVVTHSGRPAKGAQAVIEATPAAVKITEFGTYGTSFGTTVQTSNADDSGIITVSGVPTPEELNRLGGRYNISIAPMDENGDGIFDSAGAYVSYTGTSLMLDPSPRLITLPDTRAPGGLGVMATNVPSLTFSSSPPTENLVKPGEPIYVVFNQAIQPDSVLAVLTDEYGRAEIGVAPTIGKTGNVLLLQPAIALENGNEYNLSLRATSADTGDFYNATGYFFGGDQTAPVSQSLKSIQYDDKSPAEGLLSPGETVYVNFSVPMGESTGSGGLEVFFNYDINGAGGIGDYPGEIGNKFGFPLYPAEPNGLPDGAFPLKPSNYTTRWYFTYGGGVTVPPQQMVKVAFDQLTSPWGEYQTIWGEPVTKSMTAGITVLPP